jgi:uncharacterized SAM-binding protein YcdF (DUF218 family)
MTTVLARRVRFLVTRILAAVIVVWLCCVAAVLLLGRADHREPVEAIVVLGAAQYAGKPSPVLQARLDHAEVLWRAGVAPLLLLTGGVGTGDTMSEAEVGRRYLRGRGVPDSAILLEPEGRTTIQSIRAAARILRERGLESVVLVSDPFHALRLRILAARSGLRAVTSPTRTSPISRNAQWWWRYVLSESVKWPVAALFPGE